ncbi:hypothetical protein [Streptomyces iconiensis]|uniref:Secreted protein n=1 Tax=Streptomyces iconiensis TaxID=1384038 RepID=A0ABT6ZQ74_9ACTN|nr:hypothetical protein [Streptomyces iconiensis]MDJ1131207.1 hypothetical protein [Streptomyces iconiensis]
MRNNKKVARYAAAGISVLALLGSASPALAENLDSRSPGAHAWSTDGAYNNRSVAVQDTASDSHSVYVKYDRKNSRGLRMDNSGGYRSKKYSGSDSSHRVTAVQACTNIQFSPDECGAYDRPGDGH